MKKQLKNKLLIRLIVIILEIKVK